MFEYKGKLLSVKCLNSPSIAFLNPLKGINTSLVYN